MIIDPELEQRCLMWGVRWQFAVGAPAIWILCRLLDG
jgi:hypothetical protein